MNNTPCVAPGRERDTDAADCLKPLLCELEKRRFYGLLEIKFEAGQVVLKMGTPRPGANPVSPERMLRKAAAEAEHRAKTRPKGRDR